MCVEHTSVYWAEGIKTHRPSNKNKKAGGSLEDFVKWLNYGEEDNSWEVEADIGEQTLVDYWAKVMRCIIS